MLSKYILRSKLIIFSVNRSKLSICTKMGTSAHFIFNTFIDVGFILYRRNSSGSQIEYLLLQKSDDSWGSTKGHLKDGESEYEAAIRQAKKELNLEEGKDFSTIPDFKHGIGYEINDEKNGPTMYLLNLWLGEIINIEKEIKISSEYKDYKWLIFEDAIKRFGTNPRDMCWRSCLKRCNEMILKDNLIY